MKAVAFTVLAFWNQVLFLLKHWIVIKKGVVICFGAAKDGGVRNFTVIQFVGIAFYDEVGRVLRKV